MKLRADLVTHLKGGTVMLVYTAAVVLAPQFIKYGLTILFASAAMGWGVEQYQKVRGEGTFAYDDMLASAAPGMLVGAVVAIYEWWSVIGRGFQ